MAIVLTGVVRRALPPLLYCDNIQAAKTAYASVVQRDRGAADSKADAVPVIAVCEPDPDSDDGLEWLAPLVDRFVWVSPPNSTVVLPFKKGSHRVSHALQPSRSIPAEF